MIKKRWIRRVVLIISVLILATALFISNVAFVEWTTEKSQVTNSEKHSLSIMTYNLHGFVIDHDFAPALELIRDFHPDILVLQEAFARNFEDTDMHPVESLSVELNMSHYGELSDDDIAPVGISILSVHPIIEEYKIELPRYDIFTKYLLITTLDTPQGNLTVMGTHMERPTHPKVQAVQAERIIQEAEKFEDLLFLCDCNSPDILIHPAYHQFATYFQDAWIASGQHAWKGNTWSTTNPRLRVDYIWFKGKISVVRDSASLHGQKIHSDHHALTAEIILEY